MELRQLRYLAAVLDLGTFVAAGDREHVSQPALWQQVRSLEREWGVVLFERSGRRVRATPAAESLRPRIRAVLDGADQLANEVAAIRAGASVPARYAAPRYARSAVYMFEVIARYRVHNPGGPMPVAVDVGTSEMVTALESGRVDLAGGVPPPGWRYRAEPLYEVWLAVVGLDKPRILDVEDLADRPLALLTPAYQSRLMVEDAFRRRDLRPNIAIEHDSPDVLLAAARTGIATAILVSDSLPLGYTEPVGELRDRGRPLGGKLSLMWREDASLSTAARRLKEEALEYARDVRAGLGPAAVVRPAPAASPLRPRPAARDRNARPRSGDRRAS